MEDDEKKSAVSYQIVDAPIRNEEDPVLRVALLVDLVHLAAQHHLHAQHTIPTT